MEGYSMSLDLAFYGRDLARRPITVRSASQIEHEIRWGRTARGLKLAGKAAAIAVGFIVLVTLLSCL